MLDVADFGGDVQAAICAAEVPDSDGRHQKVGFPPGVFECAELEWNTHPSLVGSNMGETILRFNGDDGGHILGMTGARGAIAWTRIENLSFDGAGRAENCIVNLGGVGFDIGFTISRVAVGHCVGDGIDLSAGEIVNLHMDRLRFTDVDGYGIYLAGNQYTEQRPISLQQFTWSSDQSSRGVLRVDDGRGYFLHISDGRIEGTSPLAADPNGDKSFFYSENTMSGTRTKFLFENVHAFAQPGDDATLLNDPTGRTDIYAVACTGDSGAAAGLFRQAGVVSGMGVVVSSGPLPHGRGSVQEAYPFILQGAWRGTTHRAQNHV